MLSTTRDLLREALEELGVQAPGQTFPEYKAAVALARYNRLLDAANAEGQAVYADQFLTYTFTPDLAPHTWGPSGATWTITNRPLEIKGASLWLSGSDPQTKVPIRIRDVEWWDDQRVPDLSTSYPTDLYPNYTWPNAELNFWPVPDAAYEAQLWARVVLAQVDLDTEFALPPGYWRAHVLTLAEECAESFNVDVSPRLERNAGDARALIYGNNRVTPRVASRDAGMPGGGHGRRYNHLTRQM